MRRHPRSCWRRRLRAGVERVVHTSSVAADRPRAARRRPPTSARSSAPAATALPYINAKHEAENEALRLAAHGLPVVIVNPRYVFGRGDVYRSSTELVRRFLRREIPAYVDGALNIVDAEDVARGHLLADERGDAGERYILGNRNFTLDRLFADLGGSSGVEPPAVKLPLPVALALAAAAERAARRAAGHRRRGAAASLWWAFRSTKAKRDLGWKPAHHEDTLVDTINWYREREPGIVWQPGDRQPLALRGGRVRRPPGQRAR